MSEISYGPYGNIVAAAQVATVEAATSFFGKVLGFASVTRIGAGVYDLALGANNHIAVSDRVIQVTAINISILATYVQTDEATGTEGLVRVLTFNDAGAATDRDFDVAVFRKGLV